MIDDDLHLAMGRLALCLFAIVFSICNFCCFRTPPAASRTTSTSESSGDGGFSDYRRHSSVVEVGDCGDNYNRSRNWRAATEKQFGNSSIEQQL